MKAFLVPYKSGRRLAFGSKEGYELKGPILFVPERGAIMYKVNLTGDADGMGLVLRGVDFFDDRKMFLHQIKKQINGEKLKDYEGQKFNLSQGVVKTDIEYAKFNKIAEMAKIAYESLNNFKNEANRIALDLEARIGANKLFL